MNCEKEKPELKKAVNKEPLASPPNGIVASLGIDSVSSNGYAGQAGLDHDSNPYITPKKRWVQRNSKEMECTTVVGKDKSMAQASVVTSVSLHNPDITPGSASKSMEALSEQEALATEHVSRDSSTPSPVAEPVEDTQTPGDETSAAKDPVRKPQDPSWILSQPPPVFPVDRGWAKMASRSSYASKVKENLNVTAQATGETQPPQTQAAPARLSQVPMSAVKMVSFPSRHRNSPFPELLTPSTPASPPGPADDKDLPSSGVGPSARPEESSQPSLVPRPPLNLQLDPLFGVHASLPGDTARSETLEDIFENQWGLSFLSEPSPGTLAGGAGGGGGGEPAFSSKRADVTPAASDSSPHREARFPAAGAPLPPRVQVPLEEEQGGAGGGVGFFAPSGDVVPSACPDTESWGRFDLRSAVRYHSAEMEGLLKLQKQDPKQVVHYSETEGGVAE